MMMVARRPAPAQYNPDNRSEAGTPLLLLLRAIFVLFFHAELVERLGLGPALLEGVLARLRFSIELVLAFLVVLLVAPDFPRLLHLGAAAGDECEEGGEAADHVCGGCATRRLAPQRFVAIPRVDWRFVPTRAVCSDLRAVGVQAGCPPPLLVVHAAAESPSGCGGAAAVFLRVFRLWQPRASPWGCPCAQIYVPSINHASGKALAHSSKKQRSTPELIHRPF